MKRPLLLFVVLAIAVGCVKEEILEQPVIPEDAIALNIEGQIDQIPTKATAMGFVDGDVLGLFAVNYENDNQKAGLLQDKGNQADNVQYVFDEKNWKWNSLKPVYYKDAKTDVDLYVYYPYQSSIESVNAYPFEVQKDQSRAETQTALSGYEASDLLWGKVENVSPSENRVMVTLRHRLANVMVSLKEGSGFAEGEFALLEKTVLATGTTRKASVDFSEGTVSPVGVAQVDGIVMAPQEDGSFRAVVIPQTVSASTPLFSITVAGVSYGFRRDASVTYEAGKMTKFTVSVSRKSPSGEYEFTLADTEILPWTEDRNTHGGEARQYYVVNVTEPGTLGSLIRADKKNPDKIRNLKVTGTVTTEDFYFMRDSMAVLEAVNMNESVVTDLSIPNNAFAHKKYLHSFVFPEGLKTIGANAFSGVPLMGQLVIPDSVVEIKGGAFGGTTISGLTFGDNLERIGRKAFRNNRDCRGPLLLPMSIKEIGDEAFEYCSFSGSFSLPSKLESVGEFSFFECGIFTGDLTIPPLIRSIPAQCFAGTQFNGVLHLNNVQNIGESSFSGCGLRGELDLTAGATSEMTEIPSHAFAGNLFSRIVLPSCAILRECAFEDNLLIDQLIIPEGCIIIESKVFSNCRGLTSVSLPSTLLRIDQDAFGSCAFITRFTCAAPDPPMLRGSFDWIGNDNVVLEVPEMSLRKYETTDGWSDFKRISAHYDFSLSRRLFRTLNASVSRSFLLRVPSGLDWSVESKPDWVIISPDHGTGNTEVVVTVAQMPRTSDTFVSETWKNGAYLESRTYAGRAGEIVFLLNEKDYRSSMTVEQYDYTYGDGDTMPVLSSMKGNGIDLVFLGDGYDARDIADGTYLQNMQEAISHFFAVEPYATYKEYFNAHIVFARSEESGLEFASTIVENKFGSYLPSRLSVQRLDEAFAFAKKAPIGPLNESLVVLLVNSSIYEGITYMYSDGSALAACPVSTNAYPYDFRGIVQHEAGGHGFGKLGDEYIYHNSYAEACPFCGDITLEVRHAKSLGWYRNLELTGDWNQVGWSHLIFNPSYSDMVDVYEGGYMHTRHIWRSEPTSCMNNNIPYFSTISRQAIVERILDYAGEEFTLEKFYAKDSRSVGPATRSSIDITKYNSPKIPLYGHHHCPVFMGESPNVK